MKHCFTLFSDRFRFSSVQVLWVRWVRAFIVLTLYLSGHSLFEFEYIPELVGFVKTDVLSEVFWLLKLASRKFNCRICYAYLCYSQNLEQFNHSIPAGKISDKLNWQFSAACKSEQHGRYTLMYRCGILLHKCSPSRHHQHHMQKCLQPCVSSSTTFQRANFKKITGSLHKPMSLNSYGW